MISPSGKSDGAAVYGVTRRHAELAHLSVAEGRFLDPLDESTHAQVCVIGPEVRRDLFGYGPAVGQLVKVNDVWLEVVGVLASDLPQAATAGAKRRGGEGRAAAVRAGSVGARDLPAAVDRRPQVRAPAPRLAARRDRRPPQGGGERRGEGRVLEAQVVSGGPTSTSRTGCGRRTASPSPPGRLSGPVAAWFGGETASARRR